MLERFYTDDEDEAYRKILRSMPASERICATCGEVFPESSVPVMDRKGVRLMSWGVARRFGKRRSTCIPYETILSCGGAFTGLWDGRCLIPASAYYAWDKRDGKLIRRRLSTKDDGMFLMAGMFRERTGEFPSFVLLTSCDGNRLRPLPPAPVLIEKNRAEAWLLDRAAAMLLLKSREPAMGWMGE